MSDYEKMIECIRILLILVDHMMKATPLVELVMGKEINEQLDKVNSLVDEVMENM